MTARVRLLCVPILACLVGCATPPITVPDYIARSVNDPNARALIASAPTDVTRLEARPLAGADPYVVANAPLHRRAPFPAAPGGAPDALSALGSSDLPPPAYDYASTPTSVALPVAARGTAADCGWCEFLRPWPEVPCRDTYVGAGLSALPNVGIRGFGGRVFSRSATRTHALEVAGTFQFIDDETFVDDDNPEAGNWYQVQLGLKTTLAPQSRRHLTLRTGVVAFEAEGEPNIVQEPGTYYGLYGGIGFETDLTDCITVGPELALIVATRSEELDIRAVPQFSWNLTWWIGGAGRRVRAAPPGELYIGVAPLLSPGLGFAFEAGQVFSRTEQVTLSFELQAGVQSARDALGFDEDGNWGQLRGGLKATWNPCGRAHLVGRAGVAWLRTTATSTFLDETGDYVGLYAGVGYEFDLSRHFTTGPELSLLAVARESDKEIQLVPQASWHFIYKF